MLPDLPRSVAEVHPDARRAIRDCLAGQAPWPLLLCGPAGTGKTRAALALTDYVVGSRAYFEVSDLCRFQNAAECGRLREQDVWPQMTGDALLTPGWLWRYVRLAPLAVLDELGTRGKVSDAHYETVKKFLDAREGRPSVLCSNHDLAVLASIYDDRVASRVGAGTVCVLGGPDRRQVRK